MRGELIQIMAQAAGQLRRRLWAACILSQQSDALKNIVQTAVGKLFDRQVERRQLLSLIFPFL